MPLDDNLAERVIRPFTIERKICVIIDTVKRAVVSTAIYSIIETARVNDLKFYDYINCFLEELPKCISDFNVFIPERLLPWPEELPNP